MKNNTVVSNKVITNMFPRYYINNRMVSAGEFLMTMLASPRYIEWGRDKRYFLYTGELKCIKN